ncbi:MAG: hypothetical protein CVU24_11855 [Betaproteobacteria bacterium HGW-Betaproteobacteria-18]|nr:MAG: hypothetical protein CVU24_11855 [Betaproteobacteria bacterium HGW-Betaproteobacteria-18]
MATKQTSSGLLSKVAKFVRYPNVDWSDLDKIERKPAVAPEPMPVHNRQTLKDMIERKRHDDAVRKREFDQLRQLLREAPIAKPDKGEKASLIGGTTGDSDLDDRALTIRKIDEIEAQMSKQWWKGQNQPSLAVSSSPLHAAPVDVLKAGSESFFVSTQLKSSLFDFDDIPTMIGYVPTMQTWTGAPVGESTSEANWQHQLIDGKGFDSSKLFAAEMADNLSDPDLEEAAVRFANGDETGAESVLLTAYRAQPTLSAVAQAQAEALFDLYRSLGQQANFEREAGNYAKHFGCPAPVWLRPADTQSKLQAGSKQALVWRCPAQLEPQALAQLPTHLPAGNGLSLDWSSLDVITASAAQHLATLFASWSEQEGALYFEGEQVLDKVLRDATPRGVRQTASFWWALRMDMLRILNWQDAFEMAAFDYCITYEAAPRPWQSAKCELLLQASGAVSQTNRESEAQSASPVRVELVGELLGDAAHGLAPLDNASQLAQALTISCSNLIRVDFSAAGSILNWVTQGQAQGCQIEFRDVPPLVASFFNLIGINQHAQVITRTH